MWKYVSRRIRDTFERSVNYFDKRSTTGLTNASTYDDNDKTTTPCRWFMSGRCWSSKNDNDTNSNRWNFDHLNSSWLGAITWSSAVVLGWYANQLIHLKHKYRCKNERCQQTSVDNLLKSLRPYIQSVNSKNALYLERGSKVQNVIRSFTPTVHLVSNDNTGKENKPSTSDSSTTPDSSDDDLGDVLNSIENKLGLAAIKNGQQQEGLNLLRSAANRNHAPALFNLGLCYELGLGVKADEKMAMELYRSAAGQEHAGAMYNLGIYYGQGRGGLKRDIDTATRLLRLAALKGQEDAIKALQSLEISVTETPVEEPKPYVYNYSHNDVLPTHLFLDNPVMKSHTHESAVY